jgi:hypothetical protein
MLMTMMLMTMIVRDCVGDYYVLSEATNKRNYQQRQSEQPLEMNKSSSSSSSATITSVRSSSPTKTGSKPRFALTTTTENNNNNNNHENENDQQNNDASLPSHATADNGNNNNNNNNIKKPKRFVDETTRLDINLEFYHSTPRLHIHEYFQTVSDFSHSQPSNNNNNNHHLHDHHHQNQKNKQSSMSVKLGVEQAYHYSSQQLLHLLTHSYHLQSHLQSLTRFFLLEHGDFFIQFMDIAEEELRKEVKEISIHRLKSLLQVAIQTSTLTHDHHREDLSCSLASHNLIQHLHLIQNAGELIHSSATTSVGGTTTGITGTVAAATVTNNTSTTVSLLTSLSQGLKGIEALQLDYQVGWPLSIVISRRAITKYQLLSRLLYFSKHVERRLLLAWQSHQRTKECHLPQVRVALSNSLCLRHRMLHFIQNFVYYITLEVIHPRIHQLQEEMSYVEDMDELLEYHERFLDYCLKECLLASQELLRNLTKIMTTCLLFTDHVVKFIHDAQSMITSTSLVPMSSTAGTGGGGGGGGGGNRN